MENSQFAVSAKPSCSQIHTVECDPAQSASKLLYVRDASSVATGDPRWSDLAKFQIATNGLPGTVGQVLGELWASYDIELYKPELVLTPYQRIVSTNSALTDWVGSAVTNTGSGFFTVARNTFTCVQGGTYLFCFVGVGTVPVALVNTGTATTFNVDISGPAASATTFIQMMNVTAKSGQTVIVSPAAWASLTVTTTTIAQS